MISSLNKKLVDLNIVVLTGAGISAESGIKTFRESNGLWNNHPMETLASMQGFENNPKLVHEFYNLRREQLKIVKPNEGHFALAELEKKCKSFTLITQNVDDLHERAGSKNLIHMHGELRRIKHVVSGESKYFEDSVCENEWNVYRPDIVWFGENVKGFEDISSALSLCDLFLSIGTSSIVYPAAGLVNEAKKAGALCIEFNLEQTALSPIYHDHFYGKASQTVSEFVSGLSRL